MPTSLRSIYQGSSSAAGGGHPVAPTDVPATAVNHANLGAFQASGIDVSNGVTVLSLTGKFAIHWLQLLQVGTSGNNVAQIRLTIDGVDIFNEFVTLLPNFAYPIWGGSISSADGENFTLCPLIVEQSLELFVYNTTATSASVRGIAVAVPN